MQINKFNLDTILNDDPLGILEVKPRSVAMNSDERLVSSFEEINNFYEQNKRAPQKIGAERTLYSRLEGIRENPKKVEELRQFDKYNLLQEPKHEIEINSIDDIFASDDLWIFDEVDEKKNIFKLIHVPEWDISRNSPESISHRKICKNFEDYEYLFIQCQKDLSLWKRKLYAYDETKLEEWMFCIHQWILLYIAKIEKPKIWENQRNNWRTLLIFENWTESNMLLRSLRRRLGDWGKIVTHVLDKEENLFNQVTDEDQENWFIYILKSLSKDDRIITKRNLYKIGFSTTPVEERIKNAEVDPTYLMSKVQIVESFQCYNVNPHKLEQLLHKFFSNSCLNIDIIDNKWNRYIPREWFIAPINVIAETIELIINWEIVKYRYDEENERIVEK